MDKILYLAMSGARNTMYAQAVNSNNLANISTAGFRSDLVAFINDGGNLGDMSESEIKPGVDYRHGSMQATGNDLDIAIKGDGFIAVASKDGTEAYTRAGNFQVTANGQLLTGSGHPVMGNGGPIAIPPYQKLDIGEDGTISIVPLGQDATTPAVVDRIKLVNPELARLEKNNEGLFRLKDGATADADATVRVSTGVVESSNVNAISSMVNMIELARQYEMQVRLMRDAKENDQASSKLMTLG